MKTCLAMCTVLLKTYPAARAQHSALLQVCDEVKEGCGKVKLKMQNNNPRWLSKCVQTRRRMRTGGGSRERI